MVLKFKPGESYNSWASRVEAFELEKARKRLAKGEDIDVVLEEMSKSVSQKLLHPILNIIRDSAGSGFDAGANRKAYDDAIKSRGAVADHVEREP
jgi:glutamyl-tRNA reductase